VLFVRKLGALAPQLPLGAGHRHAFAGPQTDEVDLELGEGGQDVEAQLPHRIGGIIHTGPQGQLHPTGHQGVGDLPRVGHRAGQPIELGHDQRVAGADGREGLIQAGPGARGAGQAAIHRDPLRCDPELLEHGLLDGEILVVG